MIAIAALLIDDAPKAQTQLGWQPTGFFEEMIHYDGQCGPRTTVPGAEFCT
jgi:hypothetical protein